MSRLATTAALAALLLATLLAGPALALPGDLPAPDLGVTSTAKGFNKLTWSYPASVDASTVTSIEVWRFDGTNTGTFLSEVKGHHTSFTDTASSNVDAFYTIRYYTQDAKSNFSSARSAHYPYCPVLIVGLSSPFITGPQTECALPPPVPVPMWSSAVGTAQNLVG